MSDTPENDALARAVAEHLRARETMGRAWGIAIEEVREGYARIAATVNGEMLNGHATAHGGALFTLADQAFAYACNARNVATVAQGASIHFLAPAHAGERLIVEAREVMRAGRGGSYAVTIRAEDGRDIATFHGLSRSIGGAILPPETDHA